MEFLHLSALLEIFTPYSLLCMTLGVLGGIFVGALPGLTTTMAVALLVPFTFAMKPTLALLTISGIFAGGIYGGSIAAILIQTPGTASSIATTFDGYPLAKKGQAADALYASIVASVFGGTLGAIALILFTPPLALFSLKFGPTETFWIAVLALSIIGSLASKNLIKGLIGGLFGVFLSTVGIDPVVGYPRFTFGVTGLNAGIEIISAMIGFFCISQVLFILEEKREKVIEFVRFAEPFSSIINLFRNIGVVLYASLIGIIVGIIPGAGGNIASLIAYDQAKRISKCPGIFGKGHLPGVYAAETANNADVSASIIPLLALGIPGSPPAAALLGVLLIHGLRPGSRLFVDFADITYTFIYGVLFSYFILLIVAFAVLKYFAKLITAVKLSLLVPVLIVLSVFGSYAIRNNVTDVYVMLGCGVFGFFLRKYDFGNAPIVLGLILGEMIDTGFVQTIRIGEAKGSILNAFFGSPISIIIFALFLLSIVWNLYNAIFMTEGKQKSEWNE